MTPTWWWRAFAGRGEGWICLVRLARRRAFAYGTIFTLEETRETATRVIQETRLRHDAARRLAWYLDAVRRVDPVPLGKARSRDPDDDPYLAAALAARASLIVTYDQDLLVLGKPFGIEIVRPGRLLQVC